MYSLSKSLQICMNRYSNIFFLRYLILESQKTIWMIFVMFTISGTMLKNHLVSRRNCLLVHGIKEVRGEATDDTINIKTIIQNLNMEIAPNNKERSHRIGQSRQPGEKPRPVIVKFVRYNHRNIIFRNKKKKKFR